MQFHSENNHILKGNTLIVEFMGGQVESIPPRKEGGYTGEAWIEKWTGDYRCPVGYTNISSMKYHRFWDWLMPIVEHIEAEFDTGIEISGNHCEIFCGQSEPVVCTSSLDGKIGAVWAAVVGFIEWYNANLK